MEDMDDVDDKLKKLLEKIRELFLFVMIRSQTLGVPEGSFSSLVRAMAGSFFFLRRRKKIMAEAAAAMGNQNGIVVMIPIVRLNTTFLKSLRLLVNPLLMRVPADSGAMGVNVVTSLILRETVL